MENSQTAMGNYTTTVATKIQHRTHDVTASAMGGVASTPSLSPTAWWRKRCIISSIHFVI